MSRGSKNLGKNSEKSAVVYLHRYPIEYEAQQFPATRRLIDVLLKKYRVIYLSMAGTKPKNEELRKGIKTIEIPLTVNIINGYDKLLKTFLYYIYLPLTLRVLKSEKPGFIICKETLPFVPLLVGRLKIPMLIDTSDWWWSILFGKTFLGRKFSHFMEKIEVKRWNNLDATAIAHTKAEAGLLSEKGMDFKKIKIINAPASKEIFFPSNSKKARGKLGFKKNEWVIAMHGVIHPSKGYPQILDWWKEIERSHRNWKLLIIGGAGSDEKICRKKIESLKLDSAIMTGWLVTQEEVNKYLNAADCLLVTRRNTPENQGVIPSSLYHNLAIGKPTIATGLPGMSEVISHKKNGYLFVPDDYNSFKNVLEYIYNHPGEAAKAGKKGIERAKYCFNPETAVKKYAEVIDSNI